MKIAFLGDIAFDSSFDLVNNPKAIDGINNVGKYLNEFDLVVANLESPFTLNFNRGPAKSAYLGSHPENVRLLKLLNVGMCNLANNHMMDYGQEGKDTTIDVLNSAGIKYFGINDNSIIIEFGNNRLAFNGYCCYSANPGYFVGGGVICCQSISCKTS